MKKSWRQYRIRDVKTGRYFYTDRKFKKVVEIQERNYARIPPEDRHKLTQPSPTFERVTVTLLKPMDCAACGKSSECTEISDEGVRYSEGWVCKRCLKTEMQQRRNHNQRNGLSRGNPEYLVIRSWPKKRSRTETVWVNHNLHTRKWRESARSLIDERIRRGEIIMLERGERAV